MLTVNNVSSATLSISLTFKRFHTSSISKLNLRTELVRQSIHEIWLNISKANRASPWSMYYLRTCYFFAILFLYDAIFAQCYLWMVCFAKTPITTTFLSRMVQTVEKKLTPAVCHSKVGVYIYSWCIYIYSWRQLAVVSCYVNGGLRNNKPSDSHEFLTHERPRFWIFWIPRIVCIRLLFAL